ncbi:hypothetical protein TSAR_008346 [Trichomalopsis sarcophagae]|uniref:Uncharacterized protein n=1 Tax=Trichomalopsis sarcophagae TaxID=543379 RepID=A0A232F4X2_9HYME|nr:hypothetical protein TSAR_008346 [Trichomalopsis sarcophagae]
MKFFQLFLAFALVLAIIGSNGPDLLLLANSSVIEQLLQATTDSTDFAFPYGQAALFYTSVIPSPQRRSRHQISKVAQKDDEKVYYSDAYFHYQQILRKPNSLIEYYQLLKKAVEH